MKIRAVVAELWEQSCPMRTDRCTDGHDETHSLFSRFCESAPKSQYCGICADSSRIKYSAC